MSIDRASHAAAGGEGGRARLWLISAVAVVTLVLIAGTLRSLGTRTAAPAPALRLSLPAFAGVTLGAGLDYPFGLALAPDGRRLAFPGTTDGRTRLWIHDLTTADTQVLPGTDAAVLPFWAPDGRAIGFFANKKLRVLTLEDAAVRDLADAPAPAGGVWLENGDILFAPDTAGGLSRRVGSNGAIDALTSVDASAGETSHRLPVVVTGGRHALFFVRASNPARQGIWVAPLADPGDRRRLISSSGHGLAVGEAIVYASEGALLAQRMDPERLALAGRPILLGAPVGVGPQSQLFATGDGGTLIFGAPESAMRELRWVDRTGARLGIVGEPMDAWDLRIAPGGGTVAVTRRDPQLRTLDIWAYDGERPLPRRISPAIDADESVVWALDGSRLAWVTGRRTVTVRGALATLPDETVRTFEHPIRVTDWSPDRRWIVLSESRPGSGDDLWLLPATGGAAPTPYAQSPFSEIQAVVSPDGRWMAYAANESGRFEIYADTFPTPGSRVRLTTGGGIDPRWRADGGALYFRRGSEVHLITLSTGTRVTPDALASERLFDAAADLRAYDAAPDGQRFLLNLPAVEATPAPLTVLVNVRSLLRFAP